MDVSGYHHSLANVTRGRGPRDPLKSGLGRFGGFEEEKNLLALPRFKFRIRGSSLWSVISARMPKLEAQTFADDGQQLSVCLVTFGLCWQQCHVFASKFFLISGAKIQLRGVIQLLLSYCKCIS